MLDITFTEDSRQRLSSIVAKGHAGFADHGEDIVCAAASAILQAARLGLEEYAKVILDVTQASGDLRMEWPKASRDDAAVQAIVSAAELAIREIARQHPAHVKFHRSPHYDATS